MSKRDNRQPKRNPVATNQLLKKGGPHGPSKKAQRKHERDRIRKGLDE